MNNQTSFIDTSIRFDRVWGMPSAWTYSIPPIAVLLHEEITEGLWCDPFAGKNGSKYAALHNDLRMGGIDAIEFLKGIESDSVDGILLDPPYSKRQIAEHYKEAGIKVTGWHTSAGWISTIKNEAARILKPKGKAICFGWNSSGLGAKHLCRLERVLLVPHGGEHNDTIVTVEIKNA